MSGDDELKEIIRDVEGVEKKLDEQIDDLKRERGGQRHLPGDEGLAKVFPTDPPQPGKRAPVLGS
jgi:hypothetical protein